MVDIVRARTVECTLCGAEVGQYCDDFEGGPKEIPHMVRAVAFLRESGLTDE